MYTAIEGGVTMLGIASNTRIFLCDTPTDMRKGFEGLSAIVEKNFPDPLTSGSLFVFISRGRALMKVLYWDSDGLAIWCKRLEKGRFAKNKNEHLLLMSRREFFMLLEGIIPKRINRRYNIL